MYRKKTILSYKIIGSEVVITVAEKNPGVMIDNRKRHLSSSRKADQKLGIIQKEIQKTRKKHHLAAVQTRIFSTADTMSGVLIPPSFKGYVAIGKG